MKRTRACAQTKSKPKVKGWRPKALPVAQNQNIYLAKLYAEKRNIVKEKLQGASRVRAISEGNSSKAPLLLSFLYAPMCEPPIK